MRSDGILVAIVGLGILTGGFGCTNGYAEQIDSTSDQADGDENGTSPGRKIVMQAIEEAGGLERWRQTDSVAYDQISKSYGPEGKKVESRTEKRVRIEMSPGLRVRIDYESNGKSVAIGFDGERGWKTVGGEPELDRSSRNHARNASFGTHFMLGLPFKLADPGTNYQRLESEEGFKRVRITYDEGTGDAPMHTYVYRFESDPIRVHRAWISDSRKTVVVEFSDFRTINGLTLATRRVRFGSNQKRDRLTRQAESKLENIGLGRGFDDDIFAYPDQK